MIEKKKLVIVGVLSLQGSYHEHIAHLEFLFKELSDNIHYGSRYKFQSREVRKVKDLEGLDGLILPGGESTTMSILLQRNGLLEPLRKAIQVDRLPCWGTCAGLILLSNEITNTKVNLGGGSVEKFMKYRSIGGLDVQVQRNSFGRQLDSFSKKFVLENFDGDLHNVEFTCVFIRAPVINGTLKLNSCQGTKEFSDDFDYGHYGVVRATRIKDVSFQEEPEVLLRIRLDEGESRIVAIRQGNVFGTSFHPELVMGDYRMHKWFIDQFIICGE